MQKKSSSASRKTDAIKPPPDFQKQAHIKSMAAYKRMYRESIENPEKFWAGQARELLVWQKPWTRVLEWKAPHAKWFTGGLINVAENCLDRHLGTFRENKAALIFEGEPGDVRTLTYRQLHGEVCRFANVLEGLGVKRGDRIAIYLPMIPEAVVAMLASARLGAVHTVIFGGFSSEAIKERVNDCGAKVIVTADGGHRRGGVVALKKNVDAVLDRTPTVEHVVVVRRTETKVTMVAGRDHWYDALMKNASPLHRAKGFPSENPLYILYTSGSTGKPKGVLHTSAGYLLGTTITSKYVFDLKEHDIYWCTADVGWVTGHSYIVYGPLSNGATTVIYEGAPNYPDIDRFWAVVARHRVSVFYTAPTAIRLFMRAGDEPVKRHDLSSLRLLGSVGEPINPEVWKWYRRVVGGGRCPVVDTWWQTETGSIMITPLPGVTPLKPGSATLPFFGVEPEVVDDRGEPVPRETSGTLVLKRPWPAMLRTLWGDDRRYKEQYWSQFPGTYWTGDGCRRDKDGYFWVVGRIDDVLNVSGHRLGTAEVESALVSHPDVAEAAVVGRPDDLKGHSLVAFVTLKTGVNPGDELGKALKKHVGTQIGPIARPEEIRFTDGLPKTRSGKIMRRILKEVAVGGDKFGDVTTLEDFTVVAKLTEGGDEE